MPKSVFLSRREKFLSVFVEGKKDECWPFNGFLNAGGYGRFHFKGKNHFASRVCFEIFRGKIPKGMLVCHSCDNPPCVNPDHLWLGTNLDNMHDKERKKRGAHHKRSGSKHYKARFHESDIIEMRRLHADGMMQRDIAKIYKIDSGSVSTIISRKHWKHV